MTEYCSPCRLAWTFTPAPRKRSFYCSECGGGLYRSESGAVPEGYALREGAPLDSRHAAMLRRER